jgi:hypothetical protein
MDQLSEKQMPRAALDQLASIPPLPENLYGGVIRRINRRRAAGRVVFGLAASLLIAVSAFTAMRLSTSRAPYSAEIADDLNGVNTYFNSNVYRENSNSYSYYEEVLYQE